MSKPNSRAPTPEPVREGKNRIPGHVYKDNILSKL